MTYADYEANGKEPNECGVPYAWIFFYAFTLITPLIFLNLFVAIILQGFSEINDKELKVLNEDNVNNFRRIWA